MVGVVQVVVVSVGEPRGEFSMLWDRSVLQPAVMESAVSDAKPLAIGLRCSAAGEPAVTGLILIRHSQLRCVLLQLRAAHCRW